MAGGEATKGARNGNWKGGRTVASNGYVLIRVGKDHPLADVRGYAYEHRIVAQAAAGRPLADGEEVHHANEVKIDNRPGNLELKANRATHAVAHRTVGLNRRAPGEANPQVLCACGCGGRFDKFDQWKRPRTYINGHNRDAENGRYD